MKNILLGLWIGFSATCPLLALDNAGDEPRLAKGRVAWFVCTSIPEGLENPVSVMSGTEISEVTLSKRSHSDPMKIPADGILRIVRKVENPQAVGKPEYLTLAQALVPEGVGKALIILVPVEKNSKGLLFQAKVQDLASFRGGECLYINMTRLRVGVDVGKTSMEIKPGEVKMSDGPALSEPVSLPVRYSFFDPEKEKWKMLSASTIAIYPTRREICIFSWDPRFKRVDYHGITAP